MGRKKNWPTDHHVLPSSLGGSDDDINLIRGVKHQKHNDMHQWGNNREILLSTRLALLTDINADTCVDPDTLEEYFQISTMMRWPKLYYPEALLSVADVGGISKAIDAAEFQKTHWMEEVFKLRKTGDALRGDSHYPSATDPLRMHYLLFFKQKNAREATQALLRERHGRKLTWVNSVREETRDALEMALGTMKFRKTEDVRERMVTVLGMQSEKVESFIAEKTKEIERAKKRLCPPAEMRL